MGLGFSFTDRTKKVTATPTETPAKGEPPRKENQTVAIVELPKAIASPTAVYGSRFVPYPLPVDPRSDLRADSHLWNKLLTAQYAVDAESEDGLYGKLHFLRCEGAIIKSDPKFRYILDKGEIEESVWNGETSTQVNPLPKSGYRALLLPYRARLTILLRNLP